MELVASITSVSYLGLLCLGKNDFDAIEALEAMSSVFCSPLD